MTEKQLRVAKPVLVAAALATIFWVSAGDLNPPPGPIIATQRTPIGPNTTPGNAVSLFMITFPGSYYLTGNITGVPAKCGIEIAASGVSLDLMGFDLVGVAGSLGGVRESFAGLTDIAVFNGSVRNWAQDGVNLRSATNNRLADLRVSGNAFHGIIAGNNAVVTECAAYNNKIRGITVGSGSTITNCSAASNTIDGIGVGDGSTISGCTARGNIGDGIEVGIACHVVGNTCDFNGNGGDGAGIHAAGADNRIDGNNVTGNDRGIDVDLAGNLIVRNSASGNGTNYDIVAGNKDAQVLSPGSAFVSTDPWANFAF